MSEKRNCRCSTPCPNMRWSSSLDLTNQNRVLIRAICAHFNILYCILCTGLWRIASLYTQYVIYYVTPCCVLYISYILFVSFYMLQTICYITLHSTFPVYLICIYTYNMYKNMSYCVSPYFILYVHITVYIYICMYMYTVSYTVWCDVPLQYVLRMYITFVYGIIAFSVALP